MAKGNSYGPRPGILEKLYHLYDQTIRDTDMVPAKMVCREKCADCCTCNVTMTGLEAAYMLHRLDDGQFLSLKESLAKKFPGQRYQPALTLNQFAAYCIAGKAVPEEENDPNWGQCPLLEDGLCTVYPVRPFGCRSMMSEGVCRESGYAGMPPLVLTINNVFLQYIEHLDHGGRFGNLSDMLSLVLQMDDPDFRFENAGNSGKTGDSIKNMKLRALMVPPEHREKLKPLLQKLAALAALA